MVYYVNKMTDDDKINDTNINTAFKIPICYNSKVQKLNDNILTELEMVKSIHKEEMPIYDNVFKPSNKASEQVLTQIAQHYTTDVTYLKETQQLTSQILNWLIRLH